MRQERNTALLRVGSKRLMRNEVVRHGKEVNFIVDGFTLVKCTLDGELHLIDGLAHRHRKKIRDFLMTINTFRDMLSKKLLALHEFSHIPHLLFYTYRREIYVTRLSVRLAYHTLTQHFESSSSWFKVLKGKELKDVIVSGTGMTLSEYLEKVSSDPKERPIDPTVELPDHYIKFIGYNIKDIFTYGNVGIINNTDTFINIDYAREKGVLPPIDEAYETNDWVPIGEFEVTLDTPYVYMFRLMDLFREFVRYLGDMGVAFVLVSDLRPIHPFVEELTQTQSREFTVVVFKMRIIDQFSLVNAPRPSVPMLCTIWLHKPERLSLDVVMEEFEKEVKKRGLMDFLNLLV